MDSEKPDLCQERQRDRAQHLLPRGRLKATLAYSVNAIGTGAISPGHRFAPTLFIWRELSMIYFGIFMLSLIVLRFLPPAPQVV